MTARRWLPVLLLAAACARTPARPLPVEDPPDVDQRIRPADLVEIRVFDEPQLSGEFRVGSDGQILLPLAGAVAIGGLTPAQAGPAVAGALKRAQLLRDPQVTVYMKQTSKRVRVLGQVTKPGTYPFVEGMDVIEAVTTAGGFTAYANVNELTVTRVVDGQSVVYKVRAGAMSEGKEKPFPLLPGDTIHVGERLF